MRAVMSNQSSRASVMATQGSQGQRHPRGLAAPTGSLSLTWSVVGSVSRPPWIRWLADERARERPGVPLFGRFAPDYLPVAIDSNHVILVAQRQHEAVDRAPGGFHVIADHPRLDEASVPVELHVLISLEVHGGVVHEHAF